MQRKWHKIEILSAVAIFFLSYLFATFLFLAKWPNWWEWTVPEQSPMTWMQTLLLFLNALAASALGIWSYLQNEKSKMYWWMLLALGFLIYQLFSELEEIDKKLFRIEV